MDCCFFRIQRLKNGRKHCDLLACVRIGVCTNSSTCTENRRQSMGYYFIPLNETWSTKHSIFKQEVIDVNNKSFVL